VYQRRVQQGTRGNFFFFFFFFEFKKLYLFSNRWDIQLKINKMNQAT
jgi:hypothetical protein